MGLATIDPHSQIEDTEIHKSPSLVLIRLVLTEIQAFKNVKMYGNADLFAFPCDAGISWTPKYNLFEISKLVAWHKMIKTFTSISYTSCKISFQFYTQFYKWLKLSPGQTESQAPFGQALCALVLTCYDLRSLWSRSNLHPSQKQVFHRLATQAKSTQVEWRPLVYH